MCFFEAAKRKVTLIKKKSLLIDDKFSSSSKKFKWSRNECKLNFSDSKEAVCECLSFGAYSITNDLYDPKVLLNYIFLLEFML